MEHKKEEEEEEKERDLINTFRLIRREELFSSDGKHLPFAERLRLGVCFSLEYSRDNSLSFRRKRITDDSFSIIQTL